MKSITFIRHGQSLANIDHLMSGQSQTPLSEYGKEELRELKSTTNYPDVDLVISSDLPRAIQTAEILFPEHEKVQFEEYRETNFGDYESRRVDDVLEEFYDLFMNDKVVGTMENYSLLKDRIQKAIKKTLKVMEERNVENVAVVAHNGVLRMVYHLYKPTTFETYRDFYVRNGRGFTVNFGEDVELVGYE